MPTKSMQPTLASLSSDDLVRKIYDQGKQNGMAMWEINAFVETFRKKQSLRKAYHILLDYARLHNDVCKLAAKRTAYVRKLLTALCSSNTETKFELPHIVSKIAEYSLKVWIAVCRWRQLQWSPRPIVIPSTTDPNSLVNFLFEFQKDVGCVISRSREYNVSFVDCDVDPTHLIVMLVTAAAEASSDNLIVSELLRSGSGGEESSGNSGDVDVEAELSPFHDLVEALGAVGREEVAIDCTWQAFVSFKAGGGDPESHAEMFPVLRIQYGEVPPPSYSLSVDSPGVYRHTCRVLLDFFYARFSPQTRRQGEEDAHEVVLRTLLSASAIVKCKSPSTRVPMQCPPDKERKLKSQQRLRPHSSPHVRIVQDNQTNRRLRGEKGQTIGEDSETVRSRSLSEGNQPTNDENGSENDDQSDAIDPPQVQNDEVQEASPDQTPVHVEEELQTVKDRTFSEEFVNDNDSGGAPTPVQDDEVCTQPSMFSLEERSGATRSENLSLTRSTNSTPKPVLVNQENSTNLSCQTTGSCFTRRSGKPSLSHSARAKSGRPRLTSARRREQTVTLMLQSSATMGLMLVLERVTEKVKDGSNLSRLLVRGFSPGCPLTTMRDVMLGDELLTVAGSAVEGRHLKDVSRALDSQGRGASPTKRPSSAVQHPKIQVQVRRYYEGWEKYSDPMDVALVTSKNTFDTSGVQPRTRTSSLSEDGDDVAPLVDYEKRLAKLKSEIAAAERDLKSSDENSFLAAKESLLRKFDELQEVQEGYLEAKLRLKSCGDLASNAAIEDIASPSPPKRILLKHSKSDNFDTKNRSTGETKLATSSSQRARVKSMSARLGGRRTIVSSPLMASGSTPPKSSMASNGTTSKASPQAISLPPIASPTHFPGDARERIPSRHHAPRSPVYTPTSPFDRRSAVDSPKSLRKTPIVMPTMLRGAFNVINRKYKTKDMRKRSAVKIAVWWKLVFPQKKLYHRLWVCNLCREWIYELLDTSVDKGIRAMIQRYHMMRHGAAVRLQRQFRTWKWTVLKFYMRIQRQWKRVLARRAVLRLVNVTRAAALVARFLFKRRLRLKQPVGKKRLYRRVIRNFIEYVGCKARDKKQKDLIAKYTSAPSNYKRYGYSMVELDKHHDMYLKRFRACIKIQSLFRMKLASMHFEEYRSEVLFRRKMLVTMCCVKLRRKIRYRRRKVAAALKLQRIWRGACLRWKLMIKVLAGIKINACWRQYRQYWKLKRCLRRTEIPLQIVLHGVRGIPANLVLSKTLKVRVSVWWAGLLHLVEQDDFNTVIQSKQPNIVRTTSLYDCVEQTSSDSMVSPVKLSTTSNPVTEPTIGKRKLSMLQTAQILKAKESGGTKTAADKLAEFARMHGTPGVNIKVGGSDVNRSAKKTGNAHAKKVFQTAVKKSMIVRNLSSLQDENDAIREESESESSSESDSSDDENQVVGAVRPRGSSAVELSARLSMDSIGRESVNTLGSNLIGDVPAIEKPSSKALLLSLSSSRDLESASLAPRRTSLKPIQRPPSPKSSGIGLLGVKTLSTALGAFAASKSMFESSRNIVTVESPDTEKKEVKYTVDLQDETLYIPGCHGNSVIRFDFFDGERKFGTNTYHLSSDQSLMFWGGEMTREVEVVSTKKSVVVGKSSFEVLRSRLGVTDTRPMFEVRIAAGAAGRSRCGWAMVSFRGNGPLKRRVRTKDIMKSLLERWDHMYVSMDGEFLFFYTSRNAVDAETVLPLGQVKSIHIELGDATGNDSNSKKGTKYIEDKFVIVITAQTRDIIHLKFQDSMARENWVRTIVQAVDYNRDFLTRRLAGAARDQHASNQDKPRRR
eukprot:CAMPEP_0185038330 /NCGR_PEP_ID=MMETSP1103-20130426/33855_1 /TAXON_ID=36769 /ORGANISM="Paraphysomonas bandaiensis, Strain Caron Lab Isolate" /LENGTH=1809 /DNA_ID=CAMNT_0027576713 /DNA_START=184 /DNA_END=5613 /DNA_ORIENTATION=+